jgi:hypothetical protein
MASRFYVLDCATEEEALARALARFGLSRLVGGMARDRGRRFFEATTLFITVIIVTGLRRLRATRGLEAGRVPARLTPRG